MPNLGDYLGQLLAEISMARMHADLETIRLAELYATHPLLRTMPVPHMRLPDVDLEIPVLIKTSEEPRTGESARGGATLEELRRKFDEVLETYLPRAGITLDAGHRRELRAALDERLNRLGVPTEVSVDVHRVADDLTSTAIRVIEELRPRPNTAEPAISAAIGAELADAVRIEFLKLRTPPPRLVVLVTSAEIREFGTADNLARLRLKVSEQGVEWTTIESEGVRRDRLVPE
jgi:hypothetical protein